MTSKKLSQNRKPLSNNPSYTFSVFNLCEISFSDDQLYISSGKYSEEVTNVHKYATME